MDTERRKAVYRIAQKHNIFILEDDPYYYLQFGEQKLPSLFSMDTDGRVLRFTIELALRFKKDFTCHPRKYVVVCDSSFEHTTYFQFTHVAAHSSLTCVL